MLKFGGLVWLPCPASRSIHVEDAIPIIKGWWHISVLLVVLFQIITEDSSGERSTIIFIIAWKPLMDFLLEKKKRKMNLWLERIVYGNKEIMM